MKTSPGNWLDASTHDVRYAFRCLKRTPAFAATAALTLAIGIGAAAAMFAVVYGVLLKPLPYGHANRLGDLEPWSSARHIGQSPATYFTYKRLGHSFENIALYRIGTGNIWIGAEPS